MNLASTRDRIRLIASGVFVACIAGYFVVLWITQDRAGGPILAYVMLLGFLGSTVDIAVRSEQIPENASRVAIVITFFWKLTVSGILAVILYCMFAAQIIQGSLFPNFTSDGSTFQSMETFLRSMTPETNVDMAKVLFWSFVAGYSEHFVQAKMPKDGEPEQPQQST
jgi:hypothetical protein